MSKRAKSIVAEDDLQGELAAIRDEIRVLHLRAVNIMGMIPFKRILSCDLGAWAPDDIPDNHILRNRSLFAVQRAIETHAHAARNAALHEAVKAVEDGARTPQEVGAARETAHDILRLLTDTWSPA